MTTRTVESVPAADVGSLAASVLHVSVPAAVELEITWQEASCTPVAAWTVTRIRFVASSKPVPLRVRSTPPAALPIATPPETPAELLTLLNCRRPAIT